MTASQLGEEVLFTAARQIGDAVARAQYLQAATGSDEALLRRVEALLAVNDTPDRLLDQPAAAAVCTEVFLPACGDEAAAVLPREATGTMVGPYKLLEQIGEGGMGDVWMAEQSEPIQRRVAVKVIKAGMDSKQVLARFDAERQALALMDHPNIAKVLDAGATATGRPYFVMELVKGTPITKFCDEMKLNVRERLELFGDVCRAVQHAHQKGIIHRDIKPSNVLVAPYDGKPVVKVIDFGVAKATGQKLTDATLFTGFGAIVGTPEYMSPEQAEVNNQDIDTRSDIYSLGVLLYELLAGSTPLTKKRVKEAAFLEVLRVIREEEPPKPSTRLSSTEELPSISAQRHTEPAKLTKLVRGELDWIVMKALEKDRNRRYETANGFAMDVQRYLADEQVLACPPSAGYRLRKFVRRNRTNVTFAGLLLLFLMVVGGAVGYTLSERASRKAKVATQVESIMADVDRLMREQKWPEALEAAKRAEAAFAGGDADDATQQKVADLVRDLQFVMRLEQIRMRRANIVDGITFDNAGSVQAYLIAFREFGVDIESMSTDAAASALHSHPAILLPVAAALDNCVDSQWNLDSKDESKWRRLVDLARRLDPDPVRDRWRGSWGQKPTPELEVELRRLAESVDVRGYSPATLIVMQFTLDRVRLDALRLLQTAQHQYPSDFWLNDHLAWQLSRRKRHNEAVRFYTASLAIRPTTNTWNNLAVALKELGRLDEAIKCYQKAIELDPNYAVPHANLGLALVDQGNVDEGIASIRKAIKLAPDYADAYRNLGDVLNKRNCIDEAIACYRKAAEIEPKHAKTCFCLGYYLAGKKELEEAAAWFRKAIEIEPKYAAAYGSLGDVLHRQRKLDEALAACKKAIEINPKLVGAHVNLGAVLIDQGKLDEAIKSYQTAIALDPKYAPAHGNLGYARRNQNRLDDAVASLQTAIKLDPKDSFWHSGLSGVYMRQNKLGDAITSLRKVVELDPENSVAHGTLGDVFLRLNKYDEAVPCYRRATELNPRFSPAHYNLGWCYYKQKKHDQAIECLNTAAKIEPKKAGVYRTISICLRDLEKWDEAIAASQKAVEVEPQDWLALKCLAVILSTCPDAKLRNPQRAIEAAKKAIELEPPFQTSIMVLSWAQYRAGLWHECIATVEKIQSTKFDDALDWIVLALSHAKLARQDGMSEKQRQHHESEARRWYDKANQQMNEWWPNGRPLPEDEWARAGWDFRIEARELLGIKEGKK